MIEIAKIVRTVSVTANPNRRKLRKTNFLVMPGETQRVSGDSRIVEEFDWCC